jgi:glycosyltransferase involved in cell wall biosynthesis
VKILQIPTGGLFSDGISSCLIEYIAAMNKTDMDIRILATNKVGDDIIHKFEMCGCKVISIPNRKENIINYFFKLCRYIAKEKIDIVHVHGSSAIMSVELLAAKIAGCKVRIAHSHNTTCENKKADRLLRPVFNKTYTEAFACGQDAGKWMFGKRKFTIIPNGRNIEKYKYDFAKRVKYRKKLKISNEALVVGHVGRFNTQKNHEYLIKIFSKIYKENQNSKLVLVGTGTTLNDVKKEVEELGLENSVIFTGALDNVSDYLSAFDVMLLPSLYEGLPLVVVEWQIAGLPCIVSDTVTKECAVTSLVKYESIMEQPVVWAEDVKKLVLRDREECKSKVWAEIRNAGYDIAEGAEKLRNKYFCLFADSYK